MNESSKVTADKNELKLWYSVNLIKTDRAQRFLNFRHLVNLGHFRHSLIDLYSSGIPKG
jgi:hypothetical protein